MNKHLDEIWYHKTLVYLSKMHAIKAELVRSRGTEHSPTEQADIIHKRLTAMVC